METSLVGKPFLIRKFKYLRAAANLVGILVGEMPSVASALPSSAAARLCGLYRGLLRSIRVYKWLFVKGRHAWGCLRQ